MCNFTPVILIFIMLVIVITKLFLLHSQQYKLIIGKLNEKITNFADRGGFSH